MKEDFIAVIELKSVGLGHLSDGGKINVHKDETNRVLEFEGDIYEVFSAPGYDKKNHCIVALAVKHGEDVFFSFTPETDGFYMLEGNLISGTYPELIINLYEDGFEGERTTYYFCDDGDRLHRSRRQYCISRAVSVRQKQREVSRLLQQTTH